MTFLDSFILSGLARAHIFSSSFVTQLLDRHHYNPLFYLADLHIDGRQLNEPVEILPLLSSCLQSLTAYYLPLREYCISVYLPLTRALRRLHLEGVSVQWMGGRVFPMLQHCSILAPRKLARLANYHVHLPSCQEMVFDGHPLLLFITFMHPT
jgi:hypothetical protein